MKKLIFVLLLGILLLITACSQKTVEDTTSNDITTSAVRQPSSVVIQFEGVPTHSNFGTPLLMRWKIDSDVPVDNAETDLRFDFVPMVDDKDLNIKSYQYHSDAYITGIPGKFESTIYPPKSGAMRIRARVRVNNVDYWTQEKTIGVD